MKVEIASKISSSLGECPTWDARSGKLFWVDSLGRILHVFDPEDGVNVSFPLRQQVGSLALTDKENIVLLAMQDGIHVMDTSDGSSRPYLLLEADIPGNRFNDGKCDCEGRFWFGSMNTEANKAEAGRAATGSLYRLTAGGELKKMLPAVTISNGMGWNLENNRFYYIDSPRRVVLEFDFDPVCGELGGTRAAVDMTKNGKELPDGMAVDCEGMLWVAIWGGGSVRRFDPRRGSFLSELVFPVKNITSCAFGGKCLDDLYVTSSNIGAEGDELKYAGSLFRVNTGGISGVPVGRFRL